MSRRRSSQQVALVLIGSAALAGCGPAPAPVTRDLYASAADCEADWGRPENCERDDRPAGTAGGGSGYLWRGPGYIEGGRDQAQREARGAASGSNRSIGRATITAPTQRGGFGALGRAFGSGG